MHAIPTGRRSPRRRRLRRGHAVLLLAAVVAAGTALGQRGQDTPALPHAPDHRAGGGLGRAGGAVPHGTSVFDDAVPGVANLDPDLLAAVRSAAVEAADQGVEFVVNSGWRSPAYQERLLRDAVARYGSYEEAARWVATPGRSAHVSGDAVDIGPSDAADWLAARGAVYGLCRVYANEPWHFELRPHAAATGCPAPYADPAHDPRMTP